MSMFQPQQAGGANPGSGSGNMFNQGTNVRMGTPQDRQNGSMGGGSQSTNATDARLNQIRYGHLGGSVPQGQPGYQPPKKTIPDYIKNLPPVATDWMNNQGRDIASWMNNQQPQRPNMGSNMPQWMQDRFGGDQLQVSFSPYTRMQSPVDRRGPQQPNPYTRMPSPVDNMGPQGQPQYGPGYSGQSPDGQFGFQVSDAYPPQYKQQTSGGLQQQPQYQQGNSGGFQQPQQMRW